MKALTAVVLGLAIAAHAQKSESLKKLTKYLPSLTEVGYVTGAINCYLQAATLVRTVNKEIALAKSLNERLGALKDQTEDMYEEFKGLKDINPYDMDSWADWLKRADNLAGYEMGQFTFILQNQILKTIDQKMTFDFVADIQRGQSYQVRDGNFQQVLNRYFMRTSYTDYALKSRESVLNSMRTQYIAILAQISAFKAIVASTDDPGTKALYSALLTGLQAIGAQLENDLRNYSGTEISAADKQIAFISDMAKNMAHEGEALQVQLAKHQENLVALNKAWRETATNKLNKDKRVDGALEPYVPERDLYDGTNADLVPTPEAQSEKPTTTNVSHEGSPSNLGDILFLQNKIDYERWQMAQTALLMDLIIANAKATFIASEAGKQVAKMNARSAATFGAENSAEYLKKRL